MSQLAASVNRLPEVDARKMIIEEKDHKSLLEFRKKEAEKTQEHKGYMAKLSNRFQSSGS